MSYGITRKMTIAIAAQDDFNTVATGTKFLLPNTTITYEPLQNKAKNNAMLGSTYEFNSVKNTTRMTNFTFTTKVDENIIPLLFMQKFDIESVLVTGESSVYQHNLSYRTNNSIDRRGDSYTVFFDDPDVADQILVGARFTALNIQCPADKSFILVQISGRAKFPTITGVTNAITSTPNEFVGRNVGIEEADFGNSLAPVQLISANLNHTFPFGSDEEHYALGDSDMSNLFLKNDNFMCELSALYGDNNFYNDYANNVKKKHRITLTDTDRFVSGSVANTRPSIIFDYPSSFVTTWATDTPENDIRKQNFTLEPMDEPGVIGSPMNLTIINSVASY